MEIVKGLVIVALLAHEWVGYREILLRMAGLHWEKPAWANFTLLTEVPILAGITTVSLYLYWFGYSRPIWLVGFLALLPVVVPFVYTVGGSIMWVLTAWSSWELARWQRKRRGG